MSRVERTPCCAMADLDYTFVEGHFGNLDVEIREGNAFIDNAQIVATDIEASNGIVHVIDAVILPPEKKAQKKGQKKAKKK